MADEPISGGTGDTAPAATATGASPSDTPPATGTADSDGGAQVDASAAEIATLKKQIQDNRNQRNSQMDKLTAQMSKMAEAMTAQSTATQEGKAKDQTDAARAELAARLTAGEVEGDELLGLFDRAVENAVSMTAAEVETLKKAVEAQNRQFAELNPAYQANKEKVDELVSMGATREVALKIAQATAAPTQPATPALASTGATGQSVGDASDALSMAEVDAQLVEMGEDPSKLSNSVKQSLAQQWGEKK